MCCLLRILSQSDKLRIPVHKKLFGILPFLYRSHTRFCQCVVGGSLFFCLALLSSEQNHLLKEKLPSVNFFFVFVRLHNCLRVKICRCEKVVCRCFCFLCLKIRAKLSERKSCLLKKLLEQELLSTEISSRKDEQLSAKNI